MANLPGVSWSADPTLQTGSVVAGRFRVEDWLGAGGMGVVVAARELATGRKVALKCLRPAVPPTGPEVAQHEAKRARLVARLLREAQAIAQLRSEHAAKLFEVGTLDGGDPFIVMELLEGTDLERFARQRGPLPFAEAAEYVLQACEAVVEAHARGIIHRDLKPANLFVTRRPDGSALIKVLDFGISKLEEQSGDPQLTATRDVLGSPLYMAPEQIRSARTVDPRADVWSLGAILYRLLAGRPAFEADGPTGILAAILSEDPQPLTEVRSDLPPQLEALVMCCLEKDLAYRVQSAEELARALRPFVQRPAAAEARADARGGRPRPTSEPPQQPGRKPAIGLPVPTPGASTDTTLASPTGRPPPARRRPWLVPVALGAIATLGVIGALGLRWSGRLDTASPTNAEPVTAPASAAVSATASAAASATAAPPATATASASAPATAAASATASATASDDEPLTFTPEPTGTPPAAPARPAGVPTSRPRPATSGAEKDPPPDGPGNALDDRL